jgi:hypothetical protein
VQLCVSVLVVGDVDLATGRGFSVGSMTPRELRKEDS